MPLRTLNTHLRPPVQLLLLAETSVIVAAVFAAIWLRFRGDVEAFTSLYGSIWPKAIVVALAVFVSLLALGLYQLHQRLYFRDMLVRVTVALALAGLMLSTIWYTLPDLTLGRGVSLITAVLVFTGLSVIRLYFLNTVDDNAFRRRTLFVGSQGKAAAIQDIRRRADRRGFRLVGKVCTPETGRACTMEGCLGHEQSLFEIARAKQADEIVVAVDDRRGTLPVNQLLKCKLGGIEVLDLPSFLERETGKIRIEFVNPSCFIFSEGFRISATRTATKRAVDIGVSALALLAAWPIMLMAAIAIKLEDGLRAPVLYRQTRVGYHGHTFSLLKFRSMIVGAESDGEARWAQKNDPRITRVGRVLRQLRIDELPQVINVLDGKMSLVGPRPERPEFVRELGGSIPYYDERHTLKPGITGWAQLKYQYGSSEHDAIEKLQYDLYYIKHHSLLLDLVIMLQTAEVILWGKGAR